MDNETQRPIEKLLRAAVRKRREQAGKDAFELHPATRRLLHGEVARQRPALKGARRLAWLWPRLAWGAGLTAAVVLMAGLLTPHLSREKAAYELAKKAETRAAAVTAPAVAPPPAAVPPAPTVPLLGAERSAARAPELAEKERLSATERFDVALRNEPAAVAKAEQRKLAMTPPASVVAAAQPAAAPRPTGAIGAIGGYTNLRDDASRLRANAPGAVSGATGEWAAAADEGGMQAATSGVPQTADKVSKSAQQSENIAGTARYSAANPLNAPGDGAVAASRRADPPTVLNSFQFVQSGNSVKVIDEDGSVYAGSVDQNADEVKDLKQAAETPAATAGAASREVHGFALMRNQVTQKAKLENAQNAGSVTAFNVMGTNRTLNQRVVFYGSLISAGNQQAATQTFQNNLRPAGVSQIKGTARVGEGQEELKIDAAAAP